MTQIYATKYRRSSRPQPWQAWQKMTPAEKQKLVASLLSWGYLVVVLFLLVLLHLISEQWWGGTVLTYMPRSIFLVPGVVVAGICGVVARKTIVPALIGLAMTAGPLMGLHGNPLRMFGVPATEEGELRVASCNVQGFRPRFGDVVAELSAIDPDVVMFQEAYDDHELLHTYFSGWNVIRESNHIVASRYPVKLLGKCYSEPFDRVTSIRVEVKTPQGIVHVYSIHQTSQRETLTAVRPWSVVTGSGVEELESETMLRDLEAAETRAFINEGDPQYPAIYAGDFNMARESSLYQNHWGDLPNAFDEGGWGYGYTGLTRTRRFWPEGFPWVKVDHILMTPHWRALECRPGTSNGSDHRLIMARLRLTVK